MEKRLSTVNASCVHSLCFPFWAAFCPQPLALLPAFEIPWWACPEAYTWGKLFSRHACIYILLLFYFIYPPPPNSLFLLTALQAMARHGGGRAGALDPEGWVMLLWCGQINVHWLLLHSWKWPKLSLETRVRKHLHKKLLFKKDVTDEMDD